MSVLALVVADDFTGANDCAASFAASGHRAYSAVGFQKPQAGASVSVLSAETRLLKPRLAQARIARFWEGLQSQERRFSYQKIDSTLRGNPAEEILGYLQGTAAARIAFCPAYPRHGRRVRKGHVRVHGLALEKSEYAKDPLSPSRASHLLDLFPASLAEGLPRGSEGSLRRRIRESQARILCFDAENELDLRRLLRACLQEGIRHFAGSSGLSEILAAEFPAKQAPPSRVLPKRRAALIGSVSETSLEQLRRLQDSDLAPSFRLVEPAARGPLERFVLSSVGGREEIRRHATGRAQREFAEKRMRLLVRRGLEMAGGAQGRLWLLTGGHCAISFFSALELEGAWIRRNLEAGLPLLEAEGPKGRVWMSTKPGGFGDSDLLLRFMRF